MLQFLGFLVFIVIATAAFFVIAALSVTLPLAAKPEKNSDKEGKENSDQE